MVTPVHRFQQIESAIVSHQGAAPSARPHRLPSNSTFSPQSPPPYTTSFHRTGSSSSRRRDDRSGRGHRVEVDPSLFLETPTHNDDQPIPVIRLCRGVWASFIIAILLVCTCAKLYFFHLGTGLEVLVTCSVMVLVLYLLVGCTLSLCRNADRIRARANRMVEPPTELAVPEPVIQPTSEPLPPTRLQVVQTPVEAPPPPYHIAVSLPQCITPPPSYEKAVS